MADIGEVCLLWPLRFTTVTCSTARGLRVRPVFRGRAALLSLALIGVAGCSYGQEGTNPNLVRQNAHPTELIEVSGTVAAPLRVDKLHAIYKTHSSMPFCKGLNFPDDGPFPLHIDLDVPTVVTSGKVAAKIEVDRYTGVCEWRLSDIYAVVQDGDRDHTQELIARALADEPDGRRPDGIRSDLTTTHCGYGSWFWCPGNSIGNYDYWPVLTDRDHRQVRFVVSLGNYPPPSDYRAPCRNPERLDTPYFPCRTKGR